MTSKISKPLTIKSLTVTKTTDSYGSFPISEVPSSYSIIEVFVEGGYIGYQFLNSTKQWMVKVIDGLFNPQTGTFTITVKYI